jgi:SAM-dependent methyltransferase
LDRATHSIRSGAGTPISAASSTFGGNAPGLELFLVGFVVLFLELACIRWFAAFVVFLQFFTNVALIASFLGMSCGCLAARSSRDWLTYYPLTALAAVTAALCLYGVYTRWGEFAIDVGHQASPQEVFFGTEYRNPDLARFVVPIELLAAFFFILMALMFVGLGQVLGRSFDAYRNRVVAYSLNIGGSLTGIIGFSVLSVLQAHPAVWFLVVGVGVGYLLRRAGGLTLPRVLALAALPLVLLVPSPLVDVNDRWSPYYAVHYNKASGQISVNSIGHQNMIPFAQSASVYSLPHLLELRSGGQPFRQVLIIGAGSGNDIAHALRYGAKRIDAVEIDPVIQDIGISDHPDRPYQDPRVIAHLDDGRHFLRTTERHYDLVVYALVDSLILHSGYANIRLESYLFTREAFEDIKRVLKPEGVFVTYNFFRQGWIVERVAAMVEHVFGCKPIVLSLPSRGTLRPSDQAGFTMIVTTCNERIANAFTAHGRFWLNQVPPMNLSINGFDLQPALLPASEQPLWRSIAPTALVHDEGNPSLATDDWPFLYLRGRLIPDLTVRSTILMAFIGLVMIHLFLPKGSEAFGGNYGRMFFLGAGFMLLETKAVVQLALLFGSTWMVNSLVFTAVLVLILVANLYVLRVAKVSLARHYAGLLILLAAGSLIPTDVFIAGSPLWRYAAPAALALGPMFFAGVIFARSFRGVPNPDYAFGANVAGAVVGGFCEAFSLLLGFRYLLLVAGVFYLMSARGSPSVLKAS